MRCLPEEEEDAAGVGAVNFNRKEMFSMPGFDRTGPSGMGPMTGGGRGYCNPSQSAYGPSPAWGPGYSGAGYGRGSGRGRGFGRGYGRGFGWRVAYPPTGGWYEPAYNVPYGGSYNINPEDEVNMLKGEADDIKSELDAIQKRIEELESKSSEA